MLQLTNQAKPSNQVSSNQVSSRSSRHEEQSFMPQLDLLSLARIAYKQWPIMLGSALILLLLAGIFTLTATNKYTASVFVLVDTSKNSMLQKQDAASIDRVLDPGLVESQVEIFKSQSVALNVVRELKLITNPNFMSQTQGLISWLISPISWMWHTNTPPTQDQLEHDAALRLVEGIKVKRIGVTYVIQVDYTDKNAELSAQIANAIADAYTVSELDARYRSTRRAGKWLQDRITELRSQSSVADLAVQKFKADNNIIDTSRGLISEQQLGDVNSQLVTAKAATAEMKAKFDRVVEVSNSDIVNATVTDALKSDIIQRLRAQYLDLAAKRQDLASKYGAEHGAVVNLKNQMNEISRSAKEELKRLAESYKSDYEIALARERSLRTSMAGLVSQAETTNKAQVALRNLESSAQTYRNLYDSFLQKFEESTHEQSFPVANARVITQAAVPTKPSSPKTMLILLGGLVLGAILGFVAAVFKEVFNNAFKNAEDVLSFTGIECLGILPNLTKEVKRSKIGWQIESDADILGGKEPITRYSILSPFSRFTETIRNVKVSIDLARGAGQGCVIGIISSIPHEGKTTFSSNLALLTAQMGHRTLLIDCDMHRSSLTKTLRPDTTIGLVDFLHGRCEVSDLIKRDLITGLDFLPTIADTRDKNVVGLITSQTMADFLNYARTVYDYIYVDLPPVVPVVDVKASSHLFDNFVFVVEWGKTSRDVVRDALISAEQVRHRVLGIVLNRADPTALKRQESYRGASYGSYYTESDGGV
jgi:polysaccharide biosynthesis transport protein